MLLCLAAGFGGRFHGAGDTIALARPVLAPALALLSLIAFACSLRRIAAVGFVIVLASGYTMLPNSPASQSDAGVQTYSAYQKNLLWSLPDLAPVAADIRLTQPDFVMLQELHQRNRPILDMLRSDFPYQYLCTFYSVGGVAVLSRLPPTEKSPVCEEGHGVAALQVQTEGGPLWLVSLHLHWPFPYSQRDQVRRVLPTLENLEGPVVVGGDFNMVPWSYSVEAIQRATRTVHAGYAGGTFAFSLHHKGMNLAGHLPTIPIDHVLISHVGEVVSLDRRDRFGSDHFGLLASFTLSDHQ